MNNEFPPVLDVCCGPRMMWFDKADDRALFHDRRDADIETAPNAAYKNGKVFSIRPDVRGTFASLQFPDNTFVHVVFDPPHFEMTQPMDMTRQEAWELAVQVAKGLLAEFTSELQINALSHDDVLKAIRICIDMRDEPEMSDQVGLFMLLADQKTDGVFSAQVDSWCEKGKH